MDESRSAPGPADSLAEPRIQKYRGPTLVWLLPMVIVILGGWLVLKAYRATGPTIAITFPSGEGIEPGQTRIKHKDVEIGKVTALGFTPDHAQVVVTAEIKREAAPLLTDQARFWVVRARISATGISGLSTLLSGAYIGMDPGLPTEGAKAARTFQGQDAPSLESIREPGALFELKTDKLGYLNLGSPVQFRQVRVGEVAAVNLAPDGRSVSVKIFLRAPYHDLVRRDSRFWQSGSVDVSVDGGGLRFHSESMLDLLLGSVVLENPVSLQASGPVPKGHVFPLFPNRDAIFEQTSEDRLYFLLRFKESVRGLSRGNPVEYQGIKVGQVEDLRLEFDAQSLQGSVPVLIALDPERFFGKRGTSDPKAMLKGLVARGLRAQLQPASLLTGGLVVNLAFHPGGKAVPLSARNGFLEIPTLRATNTALVENLTSFVERLQKLPMEELLGELRASLPALRATLDQTRALASRLDQETAPQAQATLVQAQSTLAMLEQALRADSPVQKDLHQALEEFAKAAKSLRELGDLLNERPQSLVWGKGKAKAKKD